MGSTEDGERREFAGDQRFLLDAGPVLELGFALPGSGKRCIRFDPEQGDRRVKSGGPAGATGGVVVQSLLQIGVDPM